MLINNILQQKQMSKYQLSKLSGVPYSTVSDLCSGKVSLAKCSAGTVYKLAKKLGVSMDSLLLDAMEERQTFEIFKSNICHRVKEMGDFDFIEHILTSDVIRRYYNKKWYAECLYLLAMLDYLCRENELPICSDYDDIRMIRLTEPLYPISVSGVCAVIKDDSYKQKAWDDAIPEFTRFNIVEGEVRNVI